jgi:hypothetical protein
MMEQSESLRVDLTDEIMAYLLIPEWFRKVSFLSNRCSLYSNAEFVEAANGISIFCCRSSLSLVFSF